MIVDLHVVVSNNTLVQVRADHEKHLAGTIECATLPNNL